MNSTIHDRTGGMDPQPLRGRAGWGRPDSASGSRGASVRAWLASLPDCGEHRARHRPAAAAHRGSGRVSKCTMASRSCGYGRRDTVATDSFGSATCSPTPGRCCAAPPPEGLPRPDVVVGSSLHPLAAWAGARLAVRHRVPFVYEFRDLWPHTLIAMGRISENGPAARGLRGLERHLGRRAARTFSPLPGGERHVRELGPRPRFLHLDSQRRRVDRAGDGGRRRLFRAVHPRVSRRPRRGQRSGHPARRHAPPAPRRASGAPAVGRRRPAQAATDGAGGPPRARHGAVRGAGTEGGDWAPLRPMRTPS